MNHALTAYSPLARGAVAESAMLKAIGTAHGTTAEQIALAFLMAEGHVVIPSSGNRARIASNFAAKEIVLSKEEMQQIRTLDAGRRLVNGDWCPVWDE